MHRYSLILFVCAMLIPGLAHVAGAAGETTTVNLSGSDSGRVFEGIGALSAGAGSRLLIDYPEPQRGQLLDFLFKPNFGASLHHLKVEIGGDVNSTEGSEPSHARTRDEFEHPRKEYFDRGYEWWLMHEAKKRNPKIYLDVLQWGAPDWLGDKEFPDSGDPNALSWDKRMPRNRKKFFTQDNADFIADFIKGARRYHGLDINYCGVWNETPLGDVWDGPRLDAPWIKVLRKTLDRNGLSRVEIIASDSEGGHDPRAWRIAEFMNKDAEVKKAIYALGAHYPQHWTTEAAAQSGKPLWASEDSTGWAGCSFYSDNPPIMGWKSVALELAKLYNLNYIDARITKTTICYLIDSYYDSLSFANASVIKANSPWSGYYEVWPPLWAMAHTGQFAQPGWRYLDGGCGKLKEGGSYVSLRSPKAKGDYSAIIETADAKTPQTLAFRLSAGLTSGPVHVWRSSEQSLFERREDIRPGNGSFAIKLEPGCIYSLTTTTGQRKGTTRPPPQAAFPMPYQENFESYPPGKMTRYFADQSGTFEVAKRADGGKCLQQPLVRRGLDWEHYPTPEPYTLIGSAKWRNYEVLCDTHLEGPGYTALFGRVRCSLLSISAPAHGYWLKVSAGGHWELKSLFSTLAEGTVAFDAHRWHKLALTFSGSRITAAIDGIEVRTIKDHTFFEGGMAGLGTGWNIAEFDNFSIREVAGPALSTVNLAVKKKTTASSNYSDAYEAHFATDGNPETRWNAAPGEKTGAWLEVDFGKPTRFNRTIMRQYGQRITDYKIQYLDSAVWRDACETGESIVSFPSVKAAKMRLLVVSANIEPSIFDLEVYDDED